MSTTLSHDELEHIKATCAEHGLMITNARRKGVMLELEPASLEALPSAQTLSALADVLGGDGIRYVALVLDGEDDDGQDDAPATYTSGDDDADPT